MTTQAPETSQLPGSLVSEVRAYSLGYGRHRGMMLALGLAGSITLLVGVRYTLVSPLFTPLDTLIFIGGLCVYTPCTLLLFLVKTRHLYYVVMPWIGCTTVLGMSLTLNSLFGDNASRLLLDQMPVYLPFIPVIVVFAYTYLITAHAVLICAIYSGVMGLGSIVFTLLHWPQSLESSALAFMLLTFLVANPAVMGMMHLTRQLYLDANRHLERALAHERRKRETAERSRHIDPVTLTLNREGASHSLRHWLSAEDVPDRGVVLCSFMLDGYETHANAMPRVEWGQVLRMICASVQGVLGPRTEIARLGGTQFLVWNRDIGASANPRGVGMQLFARLQSLELGLKQPASFSIGVASIQPGQSADMLIEAANFQLFLAHSRGGGQLSVADEP